MSALAQAGYDRFDAYVLKTVSDGPGICILEAAAASGVATVNNPRAIRLVRDKAAGAARARAANIPFPRTYFVVDLRHVGLIPREHFPLVIKPSNGSSTRDVHLVRRPAEVRDLDLDLSRSRFFLAQCFVENEGYDVKPYSIGRDVFAVRRASPLHSGIEVTERQVEVTPQMRRIAMNVRRVFGLDIFGVDVVRGPRGWVAVDINDFPGFRGVPEAIALVASAIMRIGRRAAMRRALRVERRPLRGFDAPEAEPRELALHRVVPTVSALSITSRSGER